jgi:hypothetical protein
MALRRKFNLQAGDQIEFDEQATVLTARRVVNQKAWLATVRDWQDSAAKTLKGHPWEKVPCAALLDDLRGGSVDSESVRP